MANVHNFRVLSKVRDILKLQWPRENVSAILYFERVWSWESAY